MEDNVFTVVGIPVWTRAGARIPGVTFLEAHPGQEPYVMKPYFQVCLVSAYFDLLPTCGVLLMLPVMNNPSPPPPRHPAKARLWMHLDSECLQSWL